MGQRAHADARYDSAAYGRHREQLTGPDVNAPDGAPPMTGGPVASDVVCQPRWIAPLDPITVMPSSFEQGG